MRSEKRSTVWTGLGLIALGGAFLVANWIGWEGVWPIFPILGGLAFWISFFTSGRRDDGLVFMGTAAVLVGAFFFGFTQGTWEWEEMEVLWPVFPLIGGVAFLAAFLAGRKHDFGTLGLSAVAFIVGVVGWLYTHNQIGEDIVQYWPALLIVVGAFGLLGALFRGARRR